MTTATATPTEALILTGSGYSLDIAPDALALKADLITSAAAITVVTTNEQADAAREQVKRLASIRNLVEKSRKQVKEPVLRIGKDIDAKAAEFMAELDASEKRLTKLIGDHATEQLRIQQEAARKAREEREAAERAEAARVKAEQEAAAAKARAEAEAAKPTESMDDVRARAAAIEEQEAKDEAARKAAEEAAAAKAKQMESFAAPIAQAPAGVTMVPDFEILDAAAVYAAFPNLCEVTVKRADTLKRIADFKLRTGTLPEVPGLRVFEKPKVGTR